MNTDQLIRIEQVCEFYNVEFTFIDSLQEYGLIKVVVVDEAKFVANEELSSIEKLIRLHYELGVNLEGIDVISNLLGEVKRLQEELVGVRNRLRALE